MKIVVSKIGMKSNHQQNPQALCFTFQTNSNFQPEKTLSDQINKKDVMHALNLF